MKNLLVAQILYKIADLLEIQEVEFKPRAFRKAAMNIESLEQPIEELAEKNKLREIPGIGEGIEKKIIEILQTGTCREYEQLKKQIPVDFEELKKVGGLGPKKIKFLYKKLHIRNLKDLESAVNKGNLKGLEHFGEKTEENLKQALTFTKSSTRFLLSDAYAIAQDLKQYLQKKAKRVEIAGSLRRMKESVGDIDILVIGKQEIADYFTKYPEVKAVLSKGPTRSSVILNNGMQADIRIIPQKSWGAALNYFTGSKEHNIALRQLALKRKWKLSEYGLFKNKKQIAGKSEEELYKKLGLNYIEPELRENQGEIEASKNNKLPKLLELKDIKADFHIHTNYSDGSSTIKEMTEAAQNLGYKTIAITDHYGSLAIANAMDRKRIQNQWKEIDSINKTSKIKILKGAEVNIRLDGSLDIDNQILQELDIVIASIHSGLKNNVTERIINAMENKYVNIIAHPSGRLINKREPSIIDYQKLFDKSRETGTILEINSSPERLDLEGMQVKNAVENSCLLAINTDAHSINSLQSMKFGVGIARRGWCEKKNVINTFDFKKLIKLLEKK